MADVDNESSSDTQTTSMCNKMRSHSNQHCDGDDDDDDDDLSSSTESEISQRTDAAAAQNDNNDTVPTATVSLDTDFDNVMQLQKQLQTLQRALDRERRTRVSLNNKRQSLESQTAELTRKSESLSKDKFALETAKIDLETKLRTIQHELDVETERRKNVEVIVARTRDQLTRSESQCQLEADTKLKLEIHLRQLQQQLNEKTEQLSQVELEKDELSRKLDCTARCDDADSGSVCTPTVAAKVEEEEDEDDDDDDDDDDQLSGRQLVNAEAHRQLSLELCTVRAELEQQVATHKDVQQLLQSENEELQQFVAKLRHDLDVDAETLAEMTTQYNVEISELRARNTELSNTIACQHDLHAEMTRLQTQLDYTVVELKATHSRSDQLHKQLEVERTEASRDLDQRTQQLNSMRQLGDKQAERLRETEQKLRQAENELRLAELTQTEQNGELMEVRSELDKQRHDCETLRDKLRQQQEENATLRANTDSLQDKVSSLQDEAENLKQLAEESHRKASDQSEQLLAVMTTLKDEHSKTKRSLEERNVELERRVEEMLDRAVSAESQRDVLQRDLTDTQTALNQLTIDTQQCRGGFERDRQQLQTQLDTLRRHLAESRDRRDVTAADTQQLADSLAAAEQTAAQYRDALRAKEADLDKAMLYLAENNKKLSDIVCSSTPAQVVSSAGNQSITMVTPSSANQQQKLETDAEKNVNSSYETLRIPDRCSEQLEKKTTHRGRNRSDRDRVAMEKQISSLKAQLSAYRKQLQGHRPRAANQSDDSEQLRRHAHHLMTELQQLRNVQKQRVVNIHHTNAADEMSRAELEAHVRMELNRKLADINTFLQQRSEQCDKLDVVSDNRHDEIRTQLRHAEQQLRETMLRASQGDDLDQRCEGQVQGQEGEERVERLEVVAECEEVEYGDHVDNKPRPDYEPTVPLVRDGDGDTDERDELKVSAATSYVRLNSDMNTPLRYVVSPPRNTEEDGDDELAKVSAATSLVTMNSDALLSWIQQQLDRSIAKHLEKAPQMQLLPTQYATTLGTSLTTPAAILDRPSRDYTSALEKNYLIA